MLKTGVDPTRYLLNPGVYSSHDTKAGSPITARIYTAYDKDTSISPSMSTNPN